MACACEWMRKMYSRVMAHPKPKSKKRMSSKKTCPFWATSAVYAYGILSWDIGMRTITLSMLQ